MKANEGEGSNETRGATSLQAVLGAEIFHGAGPRDCCVVAALRQVVGEINERTLSSWRLGAPLFDLVFARTTRRDRMVLDALWSSSLVCQLLSPIWAICQLPLSEVGSHGQRPSPGCSCPQLSSLPGCVNRLRKGWGGGSICEARQKRSLFMLCLRKWLVQLSGLSQGQEHLPLRPRSCAGTKGRRVKSRVLSPKDPGLGRHLQELSESVNGTS